MGLETLCDEILQLIFSSLHDPTPFTLLSKRLYDFSQDPYARAQYFLNRYGRAQAIYEALGKGKVVNEKVLDILISSGAHISRYLIQIAMHHYFHTQAHPFVKTRWVRNVKFEVFVHFLQRGAEIYGDIPREKGKDDGSLFNSFVRERSFPASMRTTSWETIKDILEKYNFFPFSLKDPVLAQFPLVLAIEPRLLPFAVANGFYMDEKYRDFVFRKMFENSSTSDRTADVIVQNVRELCRLDPQMFLSRTVAAEICMESQNNESGYSALKTLAKSGDLLFDLGTLVQDLIKLFMKSRSLTQTNTQANLRRLFADFPRCGSDPNVRLVMILTAFLPAAAGGTAGSGNGSSTANLPSLKERLEALKLEPSFSLDDMMNLFIHPLMEKYQVVFEYMKKELMIERGGDKGEATGTRRKGMNKAEIKSVVEKIAMRLLEIDCKGKLLRLLHENQDLHESVREVIVRTVLDKYGEEVKFENVPDLSSSSLSSLHTQGGSGNETGPSTTFQASLCKDRTLYVKPTDEAYFWTRDTVNPISQESTTQASNSVGGDAEEQTAMEPENDVSEGREPEVEPDLGVIGQNSLTTMIHQEELFPVRSRRRTYNPMFLNHDHLSYFPTDCLSVAQWIKSEFGSMSSVTAVYLKHAILNDSTSVLRSYLQSPYTSGSPVPITLNHFELLARVGKGASSALFEAIQKGAVFYRREEDYIDPEQDRMAMRSSKWKSDKSRADSGSFSNPQVEVVIQRSLATDFGVASSGSSSSSGIGRKRPRRSAAAAVANRSYVVPDSDDEDTEAQDAMVIDQPEEKVIPKKIDHLHLWVQHLGDLQKSEQAKFRERKRRAAAEASSVIVEKTEFLKSLSSGLRLLRKHVEEKRQTCEALIGPASDDDDEEYVYHPPRAKKRKVQPRKGSPLTTLQD
ncbi:hypothetical protein GYMLUDRAFT_50095 [Collybiopsis luxurians FD-317 M1]|uniref:Uncharacterized protein n=1 Tax=Collybiopsis luxurians FD-317 M1 TaxID=944289 RepID=A0A0D0C2H9_9AGAR|nr:hypothetical protein GYMLUDRAFT_50095 [Collybiopsis luxurians FD-317 M1]